MSGEFFSFLPFFLPRNTPHVIFVIHDTNITFFYFISFNASNCSELKLYPRPHCKSYQLQSPPAYAPDASEHHSSNGRVLQIAQDSAATAIRKYWNEVDFVLANVVTVYQRQSWARQSTLSCRRVNRTVLEVARWITAIHHAIPQRLFHVRLCCRHFWSAACPVTLASVRAGNSRQQWQRCQHLCFHFILWWQFAVIIKPCRHALLCGISCFFASSLRIIIAISIYILLFLFLRDLISLFALYSWLRYSYATTVLQIALLLPMVTR